MASRVKRGPLPRRIARTETSGCFASLTFPSLRRPRALGRAPQLCSPRRARVAVRERPSADDQQPAERQEAEIPQERVRGRLTDVMETEDVVVDDALHDVEDSPAQKQSAEEPSTGMAGAPADCPV